MAEIFAAFFLLAGAAISLVAAIGVARLPDAFLRMHAATKAGVVGAGFTLIGVALAFDSGDAWFRTVLIIIFLLVTVPISSHALGRASYMGGATMWSGTVMDDLQGVLPRHAIDTEAPAQRARMPATADADADRVADAHPRRLALALAGGPDGAPALGAALDALGGARTEVTLLGLLCSASLAQTGPLPVGGGHHAKRLAETRLAAAREAVASLAGRMEARCEAAGLDFRMRHEEGDAQALLTRAAAQHDITVLPRAAWFDQAQALSPGQATQRAASLAMPGLLLAAADFTAPSAVNFLHEGDANSDEALKRFLGLELFADVPLTLTGLELPGAEAALAEAAALAAARGRRRVEIAEQRLDPDRAPPLEAFSGDVLAVIPAASSGQRLAWRGLREMEASVLLA